MFEFQQVWTQCRAKVLEAMQGCLDAGNKDKVRRAIEEVNELAGRIEKVAEEAAGRTQRFIY